MLKMLENHPNLHVLISRKSDGSMKIFQKKHESNEILENRKKFLENHAINTSDLVSAGLCHGKEVRIVSIDDKGKIIENTDGLFTKEKGIFLSVTVADCLPIFFYDAKSKAVGIAHAGWRGLKRNIVSEMISIFKSNGSLPEDIAVEIGPAIGTCHYEAGEDVVGEFSRFGEEIVKKREGRKFLDLKRIAQLQLIENGVLSKNIEVNGECTFCEKEKYFSFRRDTEGDIKNLEAMIAVIGLKK